MRRALDKHSCRGLHHDFTAHARLFRKLIVNPLYENLRSRRPAEMEAAGTWALLLLLLLLVVTLVLPETWARHSSIFGLPWWLRW